MNDIQLGATPYLSSAKNIKLCGIEGNAFAISSHIVARSDLLTRASLRAAQTIDMCSQQPGTFSIQPFWSDVLINLLVLIMWASNRLDTRLNKSLPSTFNKAIDR